MYFASFADLLHMAGHGVFVWASYGITFACLVLLTLYPLRRKQKLLAAIKQRRLFEQANYVE